MEKKNVFTYRLGVILLFSISASLLLLSLQHFTRIYSGENSLDKYFSGSKKTLFTVEGKITQLENHYTRHPVRKFSFRKPFLHDKKLIRQQAAADPVVIIHFNGTPTRVQLTKSPLKYNKDFAYSLTLDDGKEDAYTAAYPLLTGGYSSETGLTYPGLFYSDGCGNPVAFKAGLAINSVSSNGQDPHQGTPSIITWDQVKDLYNKKWDIFNHSYSHKHGAGTNYQEEVDNNTSYIKSQTGIDLTHFVVPSGDSEYTSYAFNSGMKAVYNQRDFPGDGGLQIDPPLAIKNFKLYRHYLSDNNYNSSAGLMDIVAGKSSATTHYWYNEFTHHVSLTPKAGGLVFSSFKSHMEKLENNYGIKGKDNVWMAPLQEVYEYLSVRELTSIQQTQELNKTNLYINFNQTPPDLRRYSMTFLVDSDKDITSVECPTASTITFKGTGATKIVNIEWSQRPSGNPTGVFNREDLHRNINLYPNPVENGFTLTFPGEKTETVFITVVSEKGEEFVIGEVNVIGKKATVDLRNFNLERGAYVVKVSSEEEQFQFSKVIVKY